MASKGEDLGKPANFVFPKVTCYRTDLQALIYLQIPVCESAYIRAIMAARSLEL